MSENNRGLLIVLGVLVLVVLIAPSISGMLGPLGGAPSPGPLGTTPQQGTPSPPQGTTPGPQGATPGVVGGLTSGLAAGLSSLSMLALWGVLIVGLVLLVSRLGGGVTSGLGGRVEDEALETLRRRYAAGEISQEEYERMREVLQRYPERTGTGTPAPRRGASSGEPWSTETRSDRSQG